MGKVVVVTTTIVDFLADVPHTVVVGVGLVGIGHRRAVVGVAVRGGTVEGHVRVAISVRIRATYYTISNCANWTLPRYSKDDIITTILAKEMFHEMT